MQFILVGLGGFFGAMARYSVSRLLSSATFAGGLAPSFPLATLMVNAGGSFAIGFLMALPAFSIAAGMPRLLFITGFLGAFTTFSTFSMETLGLLESGQVGRALLNIGLNLLLCLCFVWLGAMLGRMVAQGFS